MRWGVGRSRTFDEREYADGHDEHGDHEIGDGQRHEKVVGDILEPAFPRDGQTDEYVAGGRGQHQEHGQQGPPPVSAVERIAATAADATADTTAPDGDTTAGDVWLADERRRLRRLQRRVQQRRRRRRPGGAVADHHAAAAAVTAATAAAATDVHRARVASAAPRSPHWATVTDAAGGRRRHVGRNTARMARVLMTDRVAGAGGPVVPSVSGTAGRWHVFDTCVHPPDNNNGILYYNDNST